ncbi:uncharacterized protein LOC119109368 [Pollicipes pollicipes]|uniref:uncharacterized protein LOC119109368 n=1 Tax=Pollicipes pollicipes TaxID=41117 RepID=UPI001884ECAC|nr:uncharacterized protein LOC119109368 [Pollicipes pollicipes]
MARLLRNFRYRRLNDPVDQANISYGLILESILALDEDFYLFPESYVPSLQTICIKSVLRQSSELFAPYTSCTGEQLLRELPPGPFDRLPPPLCDLLCDLLLWLRDPQSCSVPLYCVISPYTRCLCLREPLSDAWGVPVERLLAARTCHLVEVTWTGAPVTADLLTLLGDSPRLAVFVTDEALAGEYVARLLARCPELRVLQLRDRGCVMTSLCRRDVTHPALRDLRLVVDDMADVAAVARVFAGLERLLVRPHSGKPWAMLACTPTEPWFHSLAVLSLSECTDVGLLDTPLAALETLTLDRCGFQPRHLGLHPRLRSLRVVCCRRAERWDRGEGGAPLAPAVDTLSVLSALELEGFSGVSVPLDLRLPAMVLWLRRCLPSLEGLLLVNMYIVTEAWTPLFRELRAAGVAVDLEGGCTIPPWRRSCIRVASAEC